MGQQQLLLLVLGIVIVGIAVVAGIQAFSEGKQKAQQDAAVSDAMRIISDTQAWKLKPQAFGGGDNGNAVDFSAVNLKALGYPVNSATDAYVTTNGYFELSGTNTAATLTVYAEDPNNAAAGCQGALISTVSIDGTTSADISWAYAT